MSRDLSRPRASTCSNAPARLRDPTGTVRYRMSSETRRIIIECPPKLGETFGTHFEIHSKLFWNLSGDFQKSLTPSAFASAELAALTRGRTWAKGGRCMDAAAKFVGERGRAVDRRPILWRARSP